MRILLFSALLLATTNGVAATSALPTHTFAAVVAARECSHQKTWHCRVQWNDGEETGRYTIACTRDAAKERVEYQLMGLGKVLDCTEMKP